MSTGGVRQTISDPQTLVLECSICTEQYGTDFDRTPRSLRCGHTFSSDCLLKILTSRGVKCPICNIEHLLSSPDVSQIPVNYAVLEILRNITETSREPPADENTPRCGVCNQKNAQVVCIDCQPGVKFLFCHPCDQREHNRPFKPVQGHRRYPIDRVPAPVFTCSCHHDKQATLYSEKLKQFACEECKRTPDWLTRSTMFVPIPDALNRLRSQSQKLNIYSLNVMSQLKDAKHKMKRIIDGLDPSASKAKLEIQTKFGGIVDLIQSRQQQLLDYVENESVRRKERLQEQLEQIQSSVKVYRDAYQDLNSLISKSDLDFLLSYHEVTGNVEALLASEDKSLHRPAITEDIPFFIARDIEQQLKTLGAVGGGITPTELECTANIRNNNMMQISWQLPEGAGRVLHFQIEYEHLPDSSPFNRDSGQMNGVYLQDEPHMHQVTGNELSAYVDYLCPGYQYRFRIRSANAAGWGMWSKPVKGRCEDFPITIHYTKKINRIRIPMNGYYRITAKGAKAADGKMHCGGKGAVITATFYLQAGDVLIILCGGMSVLQKFSTGGGGGTFIAVNEINHDNLLIAAGGGGGTRGVDESDFDGCDASLEPNGTDGRGGEHGKGGVNSNAGEDAHPDDYQPCWGFGGAGFLQDSSTASSFLKGGHGGQCGGFGGGGAIGQYGGGGGGGYSGGGGGRGGGGGGSFVRNDGIDVTKAIGNENNGSVMVEKAPHPPYPGQIPPVNRSDSNLTSSSGYSTRHYNSPLQSQFSQISSANSANDVKGLQSIPEKNNSDEQPGKTPSSHSSPLNTAVHGTLPTNQGPVHEEAKANTNSNASTAASAVSSDTNTLVEPHSVISIVNTNDRNSTSVTINTQTERSNQGRMAHPDQGVSNVGVSTGHPP